MTLKLSHGERESIDLVLDRATTADQSPMTNTTQTMTTQFGSQVGAPSIVITSAVQQLLGLLATMPAMDPPADLVTRTMARIEGSVTHMQAGSMEGNVLINRLSAQPLQ